jgi:hypothetical protein
MQSLKVWRWLCTTKKSTFHINVTRWQSTVSHPFHCPENKKLKSSWIDTAMCFVRIPGIRYLDSKFAAQLLFVHWLFITSEKHPGHRTGSASTVLAPILTGKRFDFSYAPYTGLWHQFSPNENIPLLHTSLHGVAAIRGRLDGIVIGIRKIVGWVKEGNWIVIKLELGGFVVAFFGGKEWRIVNFRHYSKRMWSPWWGCCVGARAFAQFVIAWLHPVQKFHAHPPELIDHQCSHKQAHEFSAFASVLCRVRRTSSIEAELSGKFEKSNFSYEVVDVAGCDHRIKSLWLLALGRILLNGVRLKG